MKTYILEFLTGLFFALTILIAALTLKADIPFIYQGF